MAGIADKQKKRALFRELDSRRPAFRQAVEQDARYTAAQRGEKADFSPGLRTFFEVLRLMWVSDAFAAHVAYRLRTTLMRRGVPVIPMLLHRFCMLTAQVSIGPGVVMQPGVYIVHGQIVVDGLVEIGTGTVISPWVTVGLRGGSIQGPVIGNDVHIGTGAKVLGPVEVGREALIGANAVVIHDVPQKVTVVGAPATVPA
jgi:serine O-acetyltransferase